MAASSVLGKRQRAAISHSSDASSAVQSPSRKRRARGLQNNADDGKNNNDSDDPFVVISPIRQTRSAKPATANSTHSNNSTTPASRIVRSKRIVSDKTAPNSSAIRTKNHCQIIVNDEVENDENVEPAASGTEFTTPKTQRYRNALPVTPKHRVQVASKPLTPRNLRTMAANSISPTKRQSSTAASSVYSAAKQRFVRSANPKRLVCRDAERNELTQFLQSALESDHGGCLYVSGPPGTGKTALIDEVCRDLGADQTTRLKIANVNCASMTAARDIYGRLVEELCADSQVFRKSEVDRLHGMFLPSKRKGQQQQQPLYLVTLDEIDHLLTTDLEILYTFFEWSMQPNSRLLLIGIANALDLTDRFLPRLKAQNLKPQLLPFLPYTPAQISEVITSLLRSVLPNDSDSGAAVTAPPDFVPFLHPAAIQLCARKVASQSGDLRKAFDLVRRTLDMVERETLDKANANANVAPPKTPLVENVNMASPLSPPHTPRLPALHEYTPITAPRATVAHVARVTSAAFSNGTTQRLQELNLQQKATLCALVSFTRRQRSAATEAATNPKTPTKSPSRGNKAAGTAQPPTVKQLFDTYAGLCRRDDVLHPLTSTEFRDVISSLETMGLVGEVQDRAHASKGTFFTPSPSSSSSSPSRTGRGRNADDKRLVCFVSEKELEGTVASGPGEGVLKALLRDESDY